MYILKNVVKTSSVTILDFSLKTSILERNGLKLD